MVRGISTASTVRRAAAIAIAGAAAVALSACGAGQVTQTDTKQSAIAGVNVTDGDLALRDLQIEFESAGGYAAGGSAALRVWIANEGQDEVRLVGVTVRANEEDDPAVAPAGLVTFVSAAAEDGATEALVEETSEEPTDDAEGEDAGAEGEDAEGEGTESATDEATAEAPATEDEAVEENPFVGDPAIDVPIAAHGYVRLDKNFADGGDHLLVEGLAQELKIGGSLWVTFHFDNGQEVDVKLTIGQSLDAQDRSYYEAEDTGH